MAPIPSAPTAPPQLGAQREPKDWKTYRCSRYFLYQGKAIECDSDLGRDGESLRPILAKTPEALAKLDSYQNTRKNVQNLRYLSALGLAMMGTGFILSKTMDSDNKVAVRNILVTSGLAISAGTFIWGLTLIRQNESKLTEATEIYNRANPKDPLEIQVTTGVTF